MVVLKPFRRGKRAVFVVLSYAVYTRLWSRSCVVWRMRFVLGISLTEVSGMKNRSLLEKTPSDTSWCHSIQWDRLSKQKENVLTLGLLWLLMMVIIYSSFICGSLRAPIRWDFAGGCSSRQLYLWGSGVSPSALPPAHSCRGAGLGPETSFYCVKKLAAFAGLVGPGRTNVGRAVSRRWISCSMN